MTVSHEITDSFIILPDFNLFIHTSTYEVLSLSNAFIIINYLVIAKAFTSPSSDPSNILMAVPSKVSQYVIFEYVN